MVGMVPACPDYLNDYHFNNDYNTEGKFDFYSKLILSTLTSSIGTSKLNSKSPKPDPSIMSSFSSLSLAEKKIRKYKLR